jgi:hypothetical protein
MNKGIKFSGETSSIIADRPPHSNHHIADRNGRVYLCNCCKRIILGGRKYYCFPQKDKLKYKLYRSLMTGKMKEWSK